MQWKFKIYVQPLDRVFHPGNALDAHIARVAVLYEDLRLENLAASEDSIPKLDESGVDLRRFYFMRRSIATVREFSEALTMLDGLPDFGPMKDRFDAEARTMWNKSIRFFRKWYPYLQKIRNDFGGHFGYAPAWFAINHLNEGAVGLEFQRNAVRQTANVRFKFAGEIAAIGMRRHKRADEPRDHFRLTFRLALAGFAHAVRCAQILAVYDIWPRFRRP